MKFFNTPKKLAIFGSAEMALMAKYYFEQDTTMKVKRFVVDDEFVREDKLDKTPIISWTEFHQTHPVNGWKMHVALSYRNLNKLREAKFIQCSLAGYELTSFISPKSNIAKDFKHGQNCFVLENQTIQPGVVFGDNVMVWSSNHIGHGTRVESHAYISSQVVISGHAQIGMRCFIGVNASIRDFIAIGSDSLLGMGSVLTRDVPSGTVILAPRSEIIESHDPRAESIIEKNFGKKEKLQK